MLKVEQTIIKPLSIQIIQLLACTWGFSAVQANWLISRHNIIISVIQVGNLTQSKFSDAQVHTLTHSYNESIVELGI